MEENQIKICYFPIRAIRPIDLEKLSLVLQTIDKDDKKFSNIIYTIEFVNSFGQLYTNIIKYLVFKKNNQINIKILGISEVSRLNLYKRIIFLPI